MRKVFRVFICVFLLAMVLCFAGCGNDDVVSGYEQRIFTLESALADQQTIVEDYEFRISELETELGKMKNSYKTLTSRVVDAEKNLAELEGEIDEVKGASDTNIKVFLADQYYLVVGDNFQLFYRSVIRAVDPYGYYIRVSGDKGHALNRYFELQPEATDAGKTFNLTIDVCDSNGNVLGTDSTKLIVANNKTTTQKTVLCIGDSLTSSGDWVSRGFSKYIAAGGKAVTIGTVHKTVSSVTYNYEGRGGWQWSSFLSKYNSTTMSPFAPTGENPSIRDYCTRNGFGEISEFYIMMTFNGLPGVFTDFTFDNSFIKDAKTLIDLIHREYPNAKISLMGLPLTSTNGGLGAYYQLNVAYHDNYGKAVTIHHYDDFLESWCKLPEYKSFMRYIDVKAQFDSEYNMPYDQKQVNNTNTSVKEPVGNAMGMHPSQNGYYQIGDTVYRALMSNW